MRSFPALKRVYSFALKSVKLILLLRVGDFHAGATATGVVDGFLRCAVTNAVQEGHVMNSESLPQLFG